MVNTWDTEAETEMKGAVQIDGGKASQAEGTVSAKALRQECA